MSEQDQLFIQKLVHSLVTDSSTTATTNHTLFSNEVVEVESKSNENFSTLKESHVINTLYRTNKNAEFVEQLNSFIKRKENEIERVCNIHYQEFVQAIDQLLKVRVGAENLKNKIVELNKEMQAQGEELIEKKKQLIMDKKILNNINLTISTLKHCLSILDKTNKINIQIENHKYYSALRMVEELQTTHLSNIIQFQFAQHIQECIPLIKDRIKIAVTKEMKSWIIKIRENSRKVGNLAMEQMSNKILIKSTDHNSSINQSNNITPIDLVINEDTEQNLIDNDYVKIDFKPLYQCLHIYDVLGESLELKNNYEEIRRQQASSILTTPFSLKSKDNIQTFRTYINDIVGFFIIEYIVMNSTQNFRSKVWIDSLWELTINKTRDNIALQLGDCESTDLFLEIKNIVVVFIQTLENYNYTVSKLLDLMIILFERYSRLLKQQYSSQLSQLIQNEDFIPMTLNSADEYEKLLNAYTLQENSEVILQGFPRTLEFSQSFPESCIIVKTFIQKFYQFIQGFTQNYGEMDDLLKKSLDSLLLDDLNGSLVRKMKSKSIKLTQIVQIYYDMEFYIKACDEFEIELSRKKSSKTSNDVNLSHIKTKFIDSQKMAEEKIFDIINEKIDVFVDLSGYNWMPEKAATEPSSYIQDIINWLETIISTTLTNLPESIKSFVYFDAFNHLSSSLLKYLTQQSNGTQKMNIYFVETIDKDVASIEAFIESLNNPMVLDCFTELRQIINLLLSPNPENFLNPSIKNRLYYSITIHPLIILLEKLLKGHENNKIALMFNNPLDYNRRKNIENLIRVLKQQYSEQLMRQKELLVEKSQKQANKNLERVFDKR
ncbi:exocyst complex subunit Sec15-like protein [Piromyces finnis]|uniref:Exocyst complex component SEC15 n=1 Tax=Piromyces finnis TaxID=1754191 RepID=A0A1Y1VLY8_9FUNG|nr:exocyst complex subunit Sec15-like protein [Piromyces finnis]|eukprot:ORX59946.1 exocyst complex subunit Sec15-like protein [Piromyces finnis]